MQNCFNNSNFEPVSKFTSDSLYCLKLDASSPKGYLQITDDYSICDGTNFCGFALAKVF